MNHNQIQKIILLFFCFYIQNCKAPTDGSIEAHSQRTRYFTLLPTCLQVLESVQYQGNKQTKVEALVKEYINKSDSNKSTTLTPTQFCLLHVDKCNTRLLRKKREEQLQALEDEIFPDNTWKKYHETQRLENMKAFREILMVSQL